MITKNGALIFGKGKIVGDQIQMTNSLGENENLYINNKYAPDDWTMSVGSGTTEPTRDDIRLTNGIPGTIVQIGTLTCDVASNGNLIFTRAFTNISDSDVTITEIVQPNETVTFSYVVEFN